MRLRRRLTSPVAALIAVVLTAGLSSGAVAFPREGNQPLTAPGAAEPAVTEKVVVVAVGDIACTPGARRTPTTCQHGRTAALASALDPDAVLALGDLQYRTGSLDAFRRSYHPTWGRLRGITYPLPGNHEYETPGASGYYAYFAGRQPGADGYYAFNLGDWRVYALNTNCGEIACAPQYKWLRRDLRAHPRTCSLFTMHHPRFSSGADHGSNEGMTRFFRIAQRNRVETVLAGHDHHYERFRRLRANGERSSKGVLSFVSGAGGKSLYGIGTVVEGSAYRRAGHFGVLRLALRPDRFRFAFKDVDGTTPDRGVRFCR